MMDDGFCFFFLTLIEGIKFFHFYFIITQTQNSFFQVLTYVLLFHMGHFLYLNFNSK